MVRCPLLLSFDLHTDLQTDGPRHSRPVRPLLCEHTGCHTLTKLWHITAVQTTTTYPDCTRHPSLRSACAPRWCSGQGNRPTPSSAAASPGTWCHRPHPTPAVWCDLRSCGTHCGQHTQQMNLCGTIYIWLINKGQKFILIYYSTDSSSLSLFCCYLPSILDWFYSLTKALLCGQDTVCIHCMYVYTVYL